MIDCCTHHHIKDVLGVKNAQKLAKDVTEFNVEQYTPCTYFPGSHTIFTLALALWGLCSRDSSQSADRTSILLQHKLFQRLLEIIDQSTFK